MGATIQHESLARQVASNQHALAAEIVEIARARARAEPWLSLPESLSFDDLPELLAALADAALASLFDPDACHALIEAAVTHGESRRREGLPEHYLFTEYHHLRLGLWDFVRDHEADDPGVDAIMRVDVALSLSTRASLLGYHRETFERRGTWDEAVAQLQDDVPRLRTGSSA